MAKIAEGGMAGVYRAWDAQLKAWRAIKVLLPEYANRPTLRGRFEREAATMARLSSPHIIRVFDVVQDEALPFMVMELAEGGTLVGWLDAYRRMPASLACDVLEQVAAGLAVAHRHGVVHRDVKPHNVLITLDGQCKLTDFGIAQVRMHERAEEMTRTGSTMGTVGYMAPEQRADAKTVDARADIYSLGAVLFKLITGTIMSDLFLMEHQPELLDEVPDVLHEVIVRACYYDRGRRFPTAEAFSDTLRQVRALLPTDPRDTPPLIIPVADAPTEPGERPFPEIAVLLDAQAKTPVSMDSLAPTRPASPVRSVTPSSSSSSSGASYHMPVTHPAADAPLYASFPPETETSGVRSGFVAPAGYELESLPPSPSGSSDGPGLVSGQHRLSLDDDDAFEATQAVVRRWAMLFGAISLLVLFVVVGSTLMVRLAVYQATAARTALYDVLLEERSILSDLERVGLESAVVEELHEHYMAFEDAEQEPERLVRAAAYVQALQARARPVLHGSTPNGLVRARASTIEAAYLAAARAHSGAVQATRTMPGRVALRLGLVERP
ncbi:MAG: serine/threonine-protein kinase [Myxococcota bacterium]